jgi:phosphatidylglycerol:prolipoprotein diacylglycerol transferase
MLPTLSLGPLVLPVPILLILIGLWLATFFSEKLSRYSKIDRNRLTSLWTIFFICLVLGARISFVARYPGAFSQNWLSIFSTNLAMFDWTGGFIVGILVGSIYVSRKRIDPWATLDSLTPGIMVFLLFLGLSFLASGSYYGISTNVPWSISLWGAARHPTQLYWMLWIGLVAHLLWPRPNQQFVPGIRFLFFTLLTSLGLLFIEYFRADSQMLIGGIRSLQIIWFLMLLVSTWQLGQFIKKSQLVNNQEVQDG